MFCLKFAFMYLSKTCHLFDYVQLLFHKTMTRHLHSYPKSFNRWGHLKAMPLRSPPRINFFYATCISVAFYISWNGFSQIVFEVFNNVDTLQADKTQLLLKKRSFDNLILGSKIKSEREKVLERSFF